VQRPLAVAGDQEHQLRGASMLHRAVNALLTVFASRALPAIVQSGMFDQIKNADYIEVRSAGAARE
jgi:hypothetical protein